MKNTYDISALGHGTELGDTGNQRFMFEASHDGFSLNSDRTFLYENFSSGLDLVSIRDASIVLSFDGKKEIPNEITEEQKTGLVKEAVRKLLESSGFSVSALEVRPKASAEPEEGDTLEEWLDEKVMTKAREMGLGHAYRGYADKELVEQCRILLNGSALSKVGIPPTYHNKLSTRRVYEHETGASVYPEYRTIKESLPEKDKKCVENNIGRLFGTIEGLIEECVERNLS